MELIYMVVIAVLFFIIFLVLIFYYINFKEIVISQIEMTQNYAKIIEKYENLKKEIRGDVNERVEKKSNGCNKPSKPRLETSD